MSLEIDVFADYVCPYCLLAEKVITGAISVRPDCKSATIVR